MVPALSVETVVKMPGTVGGAVDAHLHEGHMGRDGNGYNACLKFAPLPTVGCRAPAKVQQESGPKGPAYASHGLKSQFRCVDE